MKINITANKLAEFITAQTPEDRKKIVMALKYPGKSHPVYYSGFHKPARDFLISGGSDATDILKIVEALKTKTGDRWHTIDSRITTEALHALIRIAPTIGRLNVSFVNPGKHAKTKLTIEGVDISVVPNLLVHGERNGKPLVGALRIFLAKESELSVRGAEIVATLQHMRLLHIASGVRFPDANQCIVLECFQQRITTAPANRDLTMEAITRACREITALWSLLDEKRAA
jgi:hypothetical protein